MDPVPRALKLAREAADYADDCEPLVAHLAKYYTYPSLTNAVNCLTIANMDAMIRYAKDQGINTGDNKPMDDFTVGDRTASFVEHADLLMSLCTNVITRFTTLRDMCNVAKSAMVDKPAAVTTHAPEPHSDAAVVYVVGGPPLIGGAATDGAGVVFHWSVGKDIEKTGNLIVWDSVKQMYIFNTNGRDSRPSSEHRDVGVYSLTYLGREYTIKYTARGIVTECSVKCTASDNPYQSAWCEVKPIKWIPEKFHKVFGRNQITK